MLDKIKQQSLCCFQLSIRTTVINSDMEIQISIKQPLTCVKTEALHENSTNDVVLVKPVINLIH